MMMRKHGVVMSLTIRWRAVMMSVFALILAAGCSSTPRASGGATAGSAGDSSGGYLSGQAAGMAAEDAERARPTTRSANRSAKKRRRTHQPVRIQRRSPVDQPRIGR